MIKSSNNIALIAGDLRQTFQELLQCVNHLAGQLTAGRGDHVVIFCENRPAWIYALYAVWTKEAVAVPVDAGATVHDLAYILKDSDALEVLCSEKLSNTVEAAFVEIGKELPVRLLDEQEGADVHEEVEAEVPCRPNDTAIICYTSGTTGSPKGVMLSFENIMANVRAVSEEVPIYTPDRRTLILLPLHHVLPLVGTIVIPMVIGGGVAICPSLTGADIMKTLQEGQIGIMIGVPRLWQTLYRGIYGQIEGKWVTRMLYRLCERVHSRRFSRLIFKAVRDKMGGKITYCVSGGAALDSQTARGLTTLGLDMLEGYGMTEAAPMICFTRPGDLIPACVGKPLPIMDVKLVDGELCAKGKNVMLGYYKRPEETAAVIDKDGYLHTGDLAKMDEQGHVFITGRRKEIIVLANGKNINPVEVEEYLEHYQEQVKEVAVMQDGDLLRAIVVPQDAWAEGKSEEEQEVLLKQQVLEDYNQTVAPYKKVMALTVLHGALPRTRMEKIQRFKLKELLSNPAAAQVAESQEQEEIEYETAEMGLLAHFVEKTKQKQMRPEDNLETDLAFDSLDMVELQSFLERSFGIEIKLEQLQRFKTMAELGAYVSEQKTKYETGDVDWTSLLQEQKADLTLPRMAGVGLCFNRLCRWIYGHYFGVTCEGLENLPEGPCILAPNHQSFLDGPLVTMFLTEEQHKDVFFYAKKDHVRSRFRQLLARNYNVIIMDMGSLKESILTLGEALKQGKKVVIFPEGRRTDDGYIGEFKKMFAILSIELQVPVVPVAIEGAFEAMPRGRFWPHRKALKVSFLPAMRPAEADYDTFSNMVRDALKAKVEFSYKL